MLAVAAVIAFVLGLILDLANVGGGFLSALMWIGLGLLAAHFAFGDRLGRRGPL